MKFPTSGLLEKSFWLPSKTLTIPPPSKNSSGAHACSQV